MSDVTSIPIPGAFARPDEEPTGGSPLTGGAPSHAPSALRVRLREIIAGPGIVLIEKLIKDDFAKDADRLRALELAMKYSMPSAVSVTDADGNAVNIPPLVVNVINGELPSDRLDDDDEEDDGPPQVIIDNGDRTPN